MQESKTRFAKERVELGKVVPLDKPFALIVEVSSVCNLRCKFCPTGDIKASKAANLKRGFLEFDLFRKIISDVRGWGGG